MAKARKGGRATRVPEKAIRCAADPATPPRAAGSSELIRDLAPNSGSGTPLLEALLRRVKEYIYSPQHPSACPQQQELKHAELINHTFREYMSFHIDKSVRVDDTLNTARTRGHPMKVTYATDDLERLFTDFEFTDGLGIEVIRAYRKRIAFIEAAKDERDFYAMKSLHFEKLSGKRSHQYSMRLNDQWRLIVEIELGTPKNTILVKSVENHYH